MPLQKFINSSNFIFNFPAAYHPQHGQQPHWPAPQGGRHQKGDIISAGMVAVHTRCLLYCLHLVCIWKAKQPEMILLKILDLIHDFDLKNLEAVWSVSRSKRRAAHKIKLGNTSRRRKSLCIASLRASSCSNFHRLKMNIQYGKIVWLKLALIWITIFIVDVSVPWPFSRQIAFTLNKIKITLHRKVGESQESHFISQLQKIKVT